MRCVSARITTFPTLLVLSGEFHPEPSKRQDDKPSAKKKTRTTSTDSIHAEETSGFTISRQITIESKNYSHLCSIIASPGHFWSVFTFDNKTWISGVDGDSVSLYGEEEFVTSRMYEGRPMQPIIHIYGMDEEKEHMQDVKDDKESEEDMMMED